MRKLKTICRFQCQTPFGRAAAPSPSRPCVSSAAHDPLLARERQITPQEEGKCLSFPCRLPSLFSFRSPSSFSFLSLPYRLSVLPLCSLSPSSPFSHFLFFFLPFISSSLVFFFLPFPLKPSLRAFLALPSICSILVSLLTAPLTSLLLSSFPFLSYRCFLPCPASHRLPFVYFSLPSFMARRFLPSCRSLSLAHNNSSAGSDKRRRQTKIN